MLTIDDIRSIPLFSTLAPAGLERLARTSADLHLGAGEFAVHEGGDRALYAVLTGKVEVVKLFDGVERRLGWRVPGTIFGEVPIAFGTTFVGGYRASETARVVRVDPKEYYSVAAACPDVAVKVGALARERIGGLQGIAAEPPRARVTIVGNRWDPACGRLRQFLARNQMTYDWMTPDAPDLSTRWPGARPGDDDCPVRMLADGTRLDRPATRDPAECLGLETRARLPEYDTVVIGGGPAGDELASRALQQARRLGAEILVTRSVARIDAATRRVYDGGDVIQARTIILATGVAGVACRSTASTGSSARASTTVPRAAK